MARSDSFFIRATVETDGTTFAETSIDLGSFVDALGKTVLRIHNTSISYNTPPPGIVVAPTNNTVACGFQLSTQSQGSLVGSGNRSTISSGTLVSSSLAGGSATFSESLDIAPQLWTGGYLVAVESIFLGTNQTIASFVDEVTIVLECTVETMTAAASMALALSQQ